MSQSATGKSLEPQQNNGNAGISVWKIGAGVFLGIAGIIGLIVLVAIYQIFADSVREVRSADAAGAKKVILNTACSASIADLIADGKKVILYSGDTVKPQMASGDYAFVLPLSAPASISMPKGCWMRKGDLE